MGGKVHEHLQGVISQCVIFQTAVKQKHNKGQNSHCRFVLSPTHGIPQWMVCVREREERDCIRKANIDKQWDGEAGCAGR